MRILCLDVGNKRVGVAVSDETGLLARGVEVVPRGERDAERIAQIAAELGAGKILYGLPVRLDGSISAQTEKTLAFIDRLKKLISLPFLPWDERLTSIEAETILIEADMSRKKRKKVIDRLTAQIILQDYLDSERLAQQTEPPPPPEDPNP